jgi:hypothetical protein
MEMYDNVDATSTTDQKRLGALLHRAVLERHKADFVVRLPAKTTVIHIRLESAIVSDIGRALIDLDVELRRTFAFLSDGSMRPRRDRGSVELLFAQKNSSTDIFVLTSTLFYQLLTSRPMDFLHVFSWFWDHRLNQTRVRSAKSLEDELPGWLAISDTIQKGVVTEEPKMISLNIDAIGALQIKLTTG